MENVKVGLKVVNALTTYLIAESYRYDGKAVRLETKLGYPVTKDPISIPNKDFMQGTKITFVPNQEVLGFIELDWHVVYKLIKMIVSLTPIGSVVDFEAVDQNGVNHKEHI